MAEETAKLPKPKMHGLLQDQIKRNIIVSLIGCTIVGLCVKFFYIERRKKIYADFYKNYDIKKDFNAIRKKGLFDSCDPAGDDEDNEEEEEKQ